MSKDCNWSQQITVILLRKVQPISVPIPNNQASTGGLSDQETFIKDVLQDQHEEMHFKQKSLTLGQELK